MRKIVVGTIIVLAVGAAAIGWWFSQNQSASAPESKPMPSASKSEKPANPNEHNYMDTDFAKKMIVHNQQGIQMADIAKKNASDDKVRQLAVRISDELTSDTKQYINWLTEWKGTYFNLSDFPEMEGHDMYPTGPGMASLGEIDALKTATGNSVDKQFLDLMIKHHEGTKEMADSVAFERMQFGEMLALRAKTIKKQAEEVRIMKQLQDKGN